MKLSKKIIHRISLQTMKSQKFQDAISVVAIILTTVLFTSLFTILSSLVYAFQQTNFKQSGGYNHGEFKSLTEYQFNILKEDTSISEYGLRRILGTGSGDIFNKHYTEISYVDKNTAKWTYCTPSVGNLPTERTNEAAVDTNTLALLDISQKIGTKFTVNLNVDGTETTENFILCGWWETDEIGLSGNILVAESFEESIFEKLDTKFTDGMTGTYNLGVMFNNSKNIENKMEQIVKNNDFQSTDSSLYNYIEISANWSYMSSQLSEGMSLGTIIAIITLLILIICTGYLIIYNIFQISVQKDIRRYGLLKTIGTTETQISSIMKLQALTLSYIGIPLGLIFGYLVGIVLTPIVLNTIGQSNATISISPWIFVLSAIFSALTVWISCLKPAKYVSSVSPIEALRYNEAINEKISKIPKTQGHVKISKIAMRNLTKNKNKVLLTIISISLSVVLFQMVYTFANSFDMDKYIKNLPIDCIVADSAYMNNSISWNAEHEMDKNTAEQLANCDFVKNGGYTYALSTNECISEKEMRNQLAKECTQKEVDDIIAQIEPNNDGYFESPCDVYALDKYLSKKLKVVDGDISKIYSQTNGIAIVYSLDDYDNPEVDSNQYKLGDTVKLTFDNKTYEYTIVASVTVPYSMSLRWYGSNQYMISSNTMREVTDTQSILYYAFDIAEGKEKTAQNYIDNLTQTDHTELNYESKATYEKEFELFKSMFLILGTVLSIIVGMIGIINFVNTVVTSILTRKYELAVLQAIGMTGRQTKKMLILEGLYYLIGAELIALLVTLLLSPVLSKVLESIFWFIKFKFTLAPILIILPIFIILGIIIPPICYHGIVKQSVVERLTGKE